MASVWNSPGDEVEATRQWSVAVGGGAVVSSTIAQVIVIASVLVGTAGEWRTPAMTGAMLEARRVLTVPGVPPAVVEAPQFWPLVVARVGLRRSKERLVPSAGVSQDQPPRESRVRVAQSPSLA